MKLLILIAAAAACFAQTVIVPLPGEPLRLPSGGAPTVIGGVTLSTLTGVAVWTSGVPSVATGTCNSSTVVKGDGSCAAVSSAFSALSTGVNSTGAMEVATGASFKISAAGVLSAPGLPLTGTWITGGSATTTKPYVLIEPAGATSAAWSTSGTGLGVNAGSGFAGNLLDVQVNGSSKASINSSGFGIFVQKVWAPEVHVSGSAGVPAALIKGANNMLTILDQTQSGFGSLHLGGDSSAYPGIKRIGNAISIRRADDSVATFSTLTACASGLEGGLAPLSDSTTATPGATITGGGTAHVLAYCNGTNWTVAAF